MQKRPEFVYDIRACPGAAAATRRPGESAADSCRTDLIATSAITRRAPVVERLAYTRSQAAEALGLSRSTFVRKVLPYVDTIEMPWGARLIPVDELERLLAERRRAAKPRPALTRRGRPPLVPADVVERIRSERASGKSLRQIANGLNTDRIPTSNAGTRWWPSTVRSVVARSRPPASA